MASFSAVRSIDALRDPGGLGPSGTTADQTAGSRWNRVVPHSLWTSLRYFNVYRLIIAAFFTVVGLASPVGSDLDAIGSDMFIVGSLVYVSVTMVFHVALVAYRQWFSVQFTFHVVADVAAITLLMHSSSGFRSGLGVMLLISLAGAALVADRVLPLFLRASPRLPSW